jgi:1-acyl-sn-glycerol-3-phosphate acyltransferase
MIFRLGFYRLLGESPERAWRFLRVWLPTIVRILAPSAGYGLDRMPETGGAVLVANHLSAIDPPGIGTYSKRTIYYMTKAELNAIPVVGDLLRMTGTFSVRRGQGDRDALRVARWLVREGHMVGLFMEGTRQSFGYPGPVHRGASVIAMQEGVPVVPCGIDSFGWSLRTPRPFAVVVGEPVDLGHLPRNGRGYKEGAKVLEGELVRLWRQAAQAVADGLPDELPDGTRRQHWPRLWNLYPPVKGRSWPAEEWAKGPLGAAYKASR